MCIVDHPNVAKCLACFEDENHFIIVTELMNCDLNVLNMKMAKRFSEDNLKVIFYQMVLAINELHKINIIHRDVKLENFLIKKDK